MLERVAGRSCDLGALLQYIASRQVPADALDQARKEYAEASRCLDSAVTLDPNDVDVLSARILGRLIGGFFNAGIDMLDGKRPDVMSLMVNESCRGDLERLANLRPDDPRACGGVAIFVVMGHVIRKGEPAKNMEELESALPRAQAEVLKTNYARLQKIARGRDANAAAAAEDTQAVLALTAFRDQKQAEAHFRRAIEVAPKHDPAWDLLTGLLAAQGRSQECVDLCLQRLKHTDNAHNRFLAAKAYELAKDYGKVEEQIRAGLKLDATDSYCTLGLAALLLRKGDATSVRAAGTYLDRLEKEGDSKLRSDLRVARSVHTALSGEPRKARDMLDDLLKFEKDHRKAQQARAAFRD
jgi:tetratricopeptide (TPR) repeat protein